MHLVDPVTFRSSVLDFVDRLNTGRPGEYRMWEQGQVALFPSCFAAMTLHYLDALMTRPLEERRAWIDYINDWQDPDTGLFVGPELVRAEFSNPGLNWEYASLILTGRALPALHVLGGRPAYPIRVVDRYLDLVDLQCWLEARDWRYAWRVGNELLNVGQLLVYARDFEGRTGAQPALDLLFDWLNAEQDPSTGLWGTNGYCDAYTAVYGGYHQLLLYYYCRQPIPHAERIVDVTLTLQHADGSFGRYGAAGACQDVDAIDILVNLYKLTGYHPTAIRRALERALPAVLRNQMNDGGFVFKQGEAYSHSGLLRTWVPPDRSHMQATWMRTHTLALISEILDDQPLAEVNWRFNDVCTVGWHRKGNLPKVQPEALSTQPIIGEIKPAMQPSASLRRRAVDFLLLPILKRLPSQFVSRLVLALVRRYHQALSQETGLDFLLQLDERMSELAGRAASAYGGGLHPRWWSGRDHPTVAARVGSARSVLHIGCGEGGLSYDLVTLTSARVIAIDRDQQSVSAAQSRYRHSNLEFECRESLTDLMYNLIDVVLITVPISNEREMASLCRQVFDQIRPGRIMVRAAGGTRGWHQAARRQMAVYRAGGDNALVNPMPRAQNDALRERGLLVTWHTVVCGQFWIEVTDRVELGTERIQVTEET